MLALLKKYIRLLLKPVLEKSDSLLLKTSIGNSLARAATASLRNIQPHLPSTWEFSAFSQNGEDGIINYLISNLLESNKYFIEIGCSNGIENNTAFLAFAKKYSGLWIDGDSEEIKNAQKAAPFYVKAVQLFINKENLAELDKHAILKNPDVLSLDIDGNDYYMLQMLLENGYRPKIIVAEYNSAFGPEQSVTIKYDPAFNMYESKFPFLYYGVSVKGWINFLSKLNYRFVTVESNGVNAFFADEDCFSKDFLDKLSGNIFKENIHQRNYFKKGWQEQFSLIADQDFFEIK